MESTSERERERGRRREREREMERERESERETVERGRQRDRLFERRKHVKHTDVFAMKETCPRMGQKKNNMVIATSRRRKPLQDE